MTQSELMYYLSDIIDIPVYLNGQKVGELSDMIIVDRDKFAEVTHVCIGRSFGRPTIYLPWENVLSFDDKKVLIQGERVEQNIILPSDSVVLLKDHILDKKVLDVSDREIEVVYDVLLAYRNNKVYIINVDLSKYSMLCRMGLKWIAKIFYNSAKYRQEQIVPWSYIEPLPAHIDSFRGDLKIKVLKDQFAEIPPEDLADILEELGHEQRMAIFSELETPLASDTLEELDPAVQRRLVASITKEKASELIDEMTPAQAADLLTVLPFTDAQAILALLKNSELAQKVTTILERQDVKIVDYVVSNYLSFPPKKTVGSARYDFNQAAKGKEAIMYIYVMEEDKILQGVLDIKELLLAEESSTLEEVMTLQVVALSPECTLKDASEMFNRYSFRALPLLDENKKMFGVIPYRDVINLRHRFFE